MHAIAVPGSRCIIDTVQALGYSLPTMKHLERELKIEAQRLGFDLVAITDLGPSASATRYRDWLTRGYHANMDYLARPDAVNKRADPRSIMPGGRSVVVVGMNYYPGDFPPKTGCTGRVSRYAWGADYHDVMMDMLRQLIDWIAEQLGRPFNHRAYVDFGPLLERELAQRSGLGWFGKNTNLIHPKLGSYFFLGELLLGLALEPDLSVIADHCGSCSACLDACPTGALIAPGVLDARRCISYLTIEHRGVIPEELRSPIGDWVFGCDICQAVCPWNKRFARQARPSRLRPEFPTLDLIEILTLDQDAFRARFRRTPLWRPRRDGLLRNALVVLGNVGSDRVIPVLERKCFNESPLVSEHAAWALDRIRRG